MFLFVTITSDKDNSVEALNKSAAAYRKLGRNGEAEQVAAMIPTIEE